MRARHSIWEFEKKIRDISQIYRRFRAMLIGYCFRAHILIGDESTQNCDKTW